MESRKEGYCEKNERQKALIQSEIENLKNSIDNAEVETKFYYFFLQIKKLNCDKLAFRSLKTDKIYCSLFEKHLIRFII